MQPCRKADVHRLMSVYTYIWPLIGLSWVRRAQTEWPQMSQKPTTVLFSFDSVGYPPPTTYYSPYQSFPASLTCLPRQHYLVLPGMGEHVTSLGIVLGSWLIMTEGVMSPIPLAADTADFSSGCERERSRVGYSKASTGGGRGGLGNNTVILPCKVEVPF